MISLFRLVRFGLNRAFTVFGSAGTTNCFNGPTNVWTAMHEGLSNRGEKETPKLAYIFTSSRETEPKADHYLRDQMLILVSVRINERPLQNLIFVIKISRKTFFRVSPSCNFSQMSLRLRFQLHFCFYLTLKWRIVWLKTLRARSHFPCPPSVNFSLARSLTCQITSPFP